MRLGIIGCGVLGSYVARQVRAGAAGDYELVSVMDVALTPRLEMLGKELDVPVVHDIDCLLSTRPQIVVEAAAREAIWQFGEKCIGAGTSLVVLSTGSLLDDGFRSRLLDAAKKAGRKVYIPSGALGGFDIARAATSGNGSGMVRATLTTRKPPEALEGAPHLAGRDLKALTAPEVLFTGSVASGIEQFPQNVNIAASLALALGRPERITLSVIADPSVTSNTHRFELEGAFGTASVEVRARPMDSNPKSSQLAGMSVVALLKRLCEPLQIG